MLIPLLPGDEVPRKGAGVEAGRRQTGVRMIGGISTLKSRSLRVGGTMEGGFAVVFTNIESTFTFYLIPKRIVKSRSSIRLQSKEGFSTWNIDNT